MILFTQNVQNILKYYLENKIKYSLKYSKLLCKKKNFPVNSVIESSTFFTPITAIRPYMLNTDMYKPKNPDSIHIILP